MARVRDHLINERGYLRRRQLGHLAFESSLRRQIRKVTREHRCTGRHFQDERGQAMKRGRSHVAVNKDDDDERYAPPIPPARLQITPM